MATLIPSKVQHRESPLLAAVKRLDPWKVLDDRITFLVSKAERELRDSAARKRRAIALCFSLVDVRVAQAMSNAEIRLKAR